MKKYLLIFINSCFCVVLSQTDLQNFNKDIDIDERIYFASYEWFKDFASGECGYDDIRLTGAHEFFFTHVKQLQVIELPEDVIPISDLSGYSYQLRASKEEEIQLKSEYILYCVKLCHLLRFISNFGYLCDIYSINFLQNEEMFEEEVEVTAEKKDEILCALKSCFTIEPKCFVVKNITSECYLTP